MTWRESALCEMRRALAAPVKLACLATASKARSALSGSQRLSIRALSMMALLGEIRASGSQRSRPPVF